MPSFFFQVYTLATEVFDGQAFIEGPILPRDFAGYPCAVKITDTLTFLGHLFHAYIYNWESETFTELAEPLFPISGASGCGAATTSDGQQQVIIAGKKTRNKLSI